MVTKVSCLQGRSVHRWVNEKQIFPKSYHKPLFTVSLSDCSALLETTASFYNSVATPCDVLPSAIRK